MGKYKILRTDTADSLLHRIILNIAEEFGAEVALEKLDYIEAQIKLLADAPDMGVIPRYNVLRKQGFRVLILEKNLVFYKIENDKKSIIVYAIVDQRQDYLSIIRGL